jgi:hypothetical protein
MVRVFNLLILILLIVGYFQNTLAQQYTKYVTVGGAGNHSGQNLANAMTIEEARGSAQPGDYIFVQKGAYPIAGQNFSTAGTSENPIIWEGEIFANDYAYTTNTVNGTNSTLFFNATSSSNPAFSMSGNYNIFRRIVFEQDVDQRQLISVSGQGVTLDSCATKYPSNGGSSSNHTILVTGTNVTFKYTSFRNGSRTIIWVRKNSGTQADNFTMEYCTLTNATNHPPIQIFPATNSTDTTTIKRPIVRNCLFIDNPYGDGIYSRYCEQFAFYNNLFIRSDGPFNIDIHTGFHYPTGTPEDTCNSRGGFAAYNTIIVNGQCNILFNKGSNQTKFENNIFYSTMLSPDMIFRFDGDWNAIYRHDFDYNLYYSTTENFGGSPTVRGTWGTNNTSVWWSNWNSVTGQEQHTIVNQAPTFANISNDNYSPLNSLSPQVGKGTPITRANGYWMDVTTDFFGNSRDPNNPTIGAIEYNTGGGDIFPPSLLGAVLNNSTTLILNFSEPLAPATAQNINNYSINNGINVSAVSLSGSQVILTTSGHTQGNYLITVNNVTDIAGNIINPAVNTVEYEYSIVDLTAPQVVSATIIDSVTLNIYFSENLESSGAMNINNYAINNINILNATLGSNLVTLTTSIHTYGAYSVIVSNVTDLAGNIIDPQQNSAIYEYQEDPSSGLLMFPVSNVLESVVPEPLHNGEKTIDGNGFYQGDLESRWSGDTMPEWLVYDLGDIQILSATKLSFYKWNEGRTYNYTLQVSTDSINWTTVRSNALSVTEEWSEEVVGPIDARYIKVIFIASNQNTWAGLWEAEFWGYLKTPTNNEDDEIKPTSFLLEQNYPNPFNPSTMIRVHLPVNTHLRLAIYNILGEFISELTNADYSSGTYEFNFEARDLSSGIYIYRIESSNYIDSKKMILMR